MLDFLRSKVSESCLLACLCLVMCFISSIDFHEFVQCFMDPFPHGSKKKQVYNRFGESC